MSDAVRHPEARHAPDDSDRMWPARNGQCKGRDFSYRIDQQAVLDWIADPDRPDRP